MSSRSNKAAALSKFRLAKRKRDLGEEDDDLFESNMKEDDDVYDVVDESEYHALVESRRQREDFVVDDDGLGYYDDGEELLGDEAGYNNDKKKPSKKRNTTAALTSASLKKARKAKAAIQAEDDHDGDADDDVIATNRKMWEFVQPGVTAQKNSTVQPEKSSAPASRSVDSVISELDNLSAAPSRARRGRGHRAPRRRPPPPSRRRQKLRPSFSSHRDDGDIGDDPMILAHDDEDNDEPDDSGAGLIDHVDEANDDENNHNDQHVKENHEIDDAASKLKEKDVEEKVKNLSPTRKVQFADKKKESVDGAAENKIHNDALAEAKITPDTQPRRRILRPKLGRRSAPAQKAFEKGKEKKIEEQNASPTKPTPTTTVDTTSESFRPEHIEAELQPSSASASTIESYTEVDENTNEKYLDMFWTDATERNSDIYLYGKVASKEDKNKFVSCCAVVKGNLRNLFVLPRKQPDGNGYYDMMEVHKEMKGILQPEYIPLKEGASWAGKVVERKYASGDSEIPREKTKYLKVVYDAKYPAPSEEACQRGGQYIHKILNAGASQLETFILKRKLMGPCWIRIRQPETNRRGPISWCALELQVDSPKHICRLDLVQPPGTSPRRAPPVVTVTLKLKTITNPKTHKQEIVSASAVCHRRVLLDTASDESRQFMTQLSLIRPIHPPDSSNAQGMARFPRDMDAEIKSKMPYLQRMPNERALLNRLITQIGLWDPDVLVGHHAWGHDMQVILARCVEHKVKIWSKIGRQRRMELPSRWQFSSGKDWAVADALSGRLLCDTYLSAQEHLHETMYSLTYLAKTQLKTNHQEIEPVDIPQYFRSSQSIVALALHTLNDAQLVQRLMFKLQILPLSKQLTGIAGNLWTTTLKGNRANRTEYLLLHAFHTDKTLPPEKRRGKKKDTGSGKAKYSGGLVLDPKVGLYDSFVLLLDFNSLYPSIIQEYNLCFTTIDWAQYHNQDHEQVGHTATPDLPPLPDSSVGQGILPRVIKSLVDSRRRVKAQLKKESLGEKWEELNIRQKALKLTANSMYGCLGFSHSRFFAQPIAAMVTSMGRQTLSRTVEIAQSTIGLDVIYGDTDSIMINTRITDIDSLKNVRELGEQVKKEVNKCYKTLELEIDGIFRSLLLLKKKKYAAVVIEQDPKTGRIKETREEKGLDLVRRDWCIQSKDTGRFILDQILSRQDKETVVSNVCNHLEELAKKMRGGELALEKFVITKGLSKQPHEYPDGKGQPHVHVAKMMIKNNQRLGVGDHIPYIITAPLDNGDEKATKTNESYADRARHPDDITRSGGVLKADVEWYLTQQILPPVSRLCEPIDGMPQGLLASRLGLDSTRYNQGGSRNVEINDDELINYKPASYMTNEERFAGVKKLLLCCSACSVESEFPGVFRTIDEQGKPTGNVIGGLQCVNSECPNPRFWGESTHFDCMSRIMNAMSVLVKNEVAEYYKGTIKCDDPVCGLQTRQLSVQAGCCLRRGCNGQMHPVVNERSLHTQLKYLECLFDVNHTCEQLERKEIYGTKKELLTCIKSKDRPVWDELCRGAKNLVSDCAFNWIAPTFWQSMFGIKQ